MCSEEPCNSAIEAPNSKASAPTGERSCATSTVWICASPLGFVTHTGHGHFLNSFMPVLPNSIRDTMSRFRVPTTTKSCRHLSTLCTSANHACPKATSTDELTPNCSALRTQPASTSRASSTIVCSSWESSRSCLAWGHTSSAYKNVTWALFKLATHSACSTAWALGAPNDLATSRSPSARSTPTNMLRNRFIELAGNRWFITLVICLGRVGKGTTGNAAACTSAHKRLL